MKRDKIIYYASTVLLTAMMLMSVSMYIFNHDNISEVFTNLGFPKYIVYPLATAKILGLVAIWIPKYKRLKEWAYAGFFFNFVLAFFAHFMIKDGEHVGALIALVLLFTSYIFKNRLNK